MDEPTTFLDVRHQMDVMRTARGLADGGKAVVLVSHDLCQALRTADRVALLADGRLCMAGTPEPVSYTHLQRADVGRKIQRHTAVLGRISGPVPVSYTHLLADAVRTAVDIAAVYRAMDACAAK